MEPEIEHATNPLEYLLLFRGPGPGVADHAPTDYQQLIERFAAWADRLTREGRLKAGHPLGNRQRIVSGRHRQVTDGPFAESKEMVTGYFLVEVADESEAVEIARDCPGLDFGLKVEVRRHFKSREEKWREEPLPALN
jgi:hypothetical protein